MSSTIECMRWRSRHSKIPICLGAPVPVLDGLVGQTGLYVLPAAAVRRCCGSRIIVPVYLIAREYGLRATIGPRPIIVVHILIAPDVELAHASSAQWGACRSGHSILLTLTAAKADSHLRWRWCRTSLLLSIFRGTPHKSHGAYNSHEAH